jgi:hypothetical protein
MMVKLAPDFLFKALQHALCIDIQLSFSLVVTLQDDLILLNWDNLLLGCCHHVSAV